MGHSKDVVFASGGVYDIPHQIGGKVLNTIYVEVPLNLVDVF